MTIYLGIVESRGILTPGSIYGREPHNHSRPLSLVATNGGPWKRKAILPQARSGSSIAAMNYLQPSLQLRVYYQAPDMSLKEHCNDGYWFEGKQGQYLRGRPSILTRTQVASRPKRCPETSLFPPSKRSSQTSMCSTKTTRDILQATSILVAWKDGIQLMPSLDPCDLEH